MNEGDIRTSSPVNSLTGTNSQFLLSFSKSFCKIAIVSAPCIGLSGSAFGQMCNVAKRIKTAAAGGGRPRHIQ